MAGRISMGNHPNIQINSKIVKIGVALVVLTSVISTILAVVVVLCD